MAKHRLPLCKSIDVKTYRVMLPGTGKVTTLRTACRHHAGNTNSAVAKAGRACKGTGKIGGKNSPRTLCIKAELSGGSGRVAARSAGIAREQHQRRHAAGTIRAISHRSRRNP